MGHLIVPSPHARTRFRIGAVKPCGRESPDMWVIIRLQAARILENLSEKIKEHGMEAGLV